ncbi:hypothetical protein M9H77_32082 [Catharanthus roseus]|uniref:Uncharacterized protein n=1 Tax=Catharanthus roseus TaxID=4058 RepID=A0ACC0A1U9_CATRO|nr:hypothetical protein M9H77_32082 [Catharanthus roseus]
MEIWRPKINHQQIGRSSSSKPNSICKKHPKHHQSPGVCSICLREKLTQLSKNKKNKVAARSSCSSLSSLSSSSSPSQCSSCASSSCSSPAAIRSDMKGGRSLIFSRGERSDQLIKSRSMAAAAVTQRIREKEGKSKNRHGKRKSNFWSKFIRPLNMGEMLATRAH